MEISPDSDHSSRSQTFGRKQDLKQVKLDFGGSGPKQFVAEKKKKVKNSRVGFFLNEDQEINLPPGISNEELFYYLKAELMGIENKIAQLTIRKQKIFDMISGISEEMTDYLERMKNEHIEMNELILNRDSFKKFDFYTAKGNYPVSQHSLLNLATYNFDSVNFSLFPVLDPESQDDPGFGNDNIIEGSLQSTQIEGLSMSNNQLKFEIKQLGRVNNAMELTDLKYLASQYGIKSDDEV